MSQKIGGKATVVERESVRERGGSVKKIIDLSVGDVERRHQKTHNVRGRKENSQNPNTRTIRES